MPDLLTWTLLPGLGLTAVIFGFAPPCLLRIILRMYPAGDVRRAELMAELRARPWRERPVWIAEQLETAFAEGLCPRIAARFRRRHPPEPDSGSVDPTLPPEPGQGRIGDIRLVLGDTVSDRWGVVLNNVSSDVKVFMQLKHTLKDLPPSHPCHFRLDPPPGDDPLPEQR